MINNLSNIKSIILNKQDRDRGIVILDRKYYIEKCLSIVVSKQFKKIKKDSTKTLESKVQRTLRKIESVLSENFIPQDHNRVYFTGWLSCINYKVSKV